MHAAWHFWFAVIFGGESGLRKLGLGGTHPLTQRYEISLLTHRDMMKKSIACLLFLLLNGCSTHVDKFSYLKSWNDKWQQCDELGKQTVLSFPKSVWFDSLSLGDKKEVFIYIYNLKEFECAQVEAEKLKSVLDDVEITTLNEVLSGFIYFEPPSDERIKHLDRDAIENLASSIEGPFNGIATAERMGLVEF
ncbi:DUF3265 domain-containing protein [Vibrio vulnificus]|nr:DUF3265 domain-containing protein [Vibrio vulnificus]MCD1421513.1 DUF3265 domain-containing protein [Vibrio vulnificus]MCD1426017.1 DUF3265 domain-containing protein [Vibrio vulnificus]MCD1437860.1 DUF3265 domain-containing protein [Vibrio vulnificus]MCD1445540.1 DUF3265 domain-containing protein [Vibrio vulnificus]